MENKTNLLIDIVNYLTNKLKVTNDDKVELFYFINDLIDVFCLEELNANFDTFIDHCKYKMKSSDNLKIQRILKQMEVAEKMNQLDSDFN